MSPAIRIRLFRVVLHWLLLAPGLALASPLVLLRAPSLLAEENFDRGCSNQVVRQPCYRGCAFEGERLYCWGGNSDGLLGLGAPSVTWLAEWVRRPDRASGDFDRPVDIAISGRNCVADAAGVWCWGANADGQLGTGDREVRMQPTRLPGLPAQILQLALSPGHGCARSSADGVWCWGRNDAGQVGQPGGSSVLLAARVPGLPADISDIAAGEDFSCAIAGGQVWCWGANAKGQLGDGVDVHRSLPRPVLGLPAQPTAVEAGARHACAIAGSGEVWCWGSNDYREAGDQDLSVKEVRQPNRVPGLPGPATVLALALFQSCALIDGRRWCWGLPDRFLEDRFTHPRELPRMDPPMPTHWLGGSYPLEGQLFGGGGQPPETRNLRARRLSLRAGRVVQVAMSETYPLCARYEDGVVICPNFYPNPGASVQIPSASDIAVGKHHACAATSDGVWCWGTNRHGALGNGRVDPSITPEVVRTGFSGTRVAAGRRHSCAWGGPEGLRCWGANESGQVSGTPTSAPVLGGASPLGAAAVDTVALGAEHSCARLVLADGSRETRCWGRLPLTEQDLATGVVDFTPRVVPPGSPLPGESDAQLRGSDYSACVGDLCYGMNFMPPDRGQARVGARLRTPFGSSLRRLALGSNHVCAQGIGSDVRCVPMIGPACLYYERDHGPSPFCPAQEAAIPEIERGWLPRVGLPGVPSDLVGGCAIVAGEVWCPSTFPTGSWVDLLGIFRAGAIEPAPTVSLPLDPARTCPAYPVASVSLLNPSASADAGSWGLDLLLADGRRYLNGGLNFGGFGTAAGAGVPGYAAFSIQNPLGPSQRVTLDLSGDGGEFVLTVESTVPPSTTRTEVLRDTLTLSAMPQRRSLTLPNGFHIVGLQPVSGTRLFLAAVGTTQPDGGPAAFQGGAVVGGYLEGERTGFAAVCTDDASAISLRTQARSTRDAAGAGDLRLQVIEGQTGAVLYDSL